VGDIVVFHTANLRSIDPDGRLAAAKVVAALPGQTVEVRHDELWVDGHYWGRLWLTPWITSMHLPVQVPWVNGRPFVIPPGQILTLGTEPLSYDSRYWGLIPIISLGGRAWPI
jgi:conjugal transfer pilin signal peptidase TrbI